MNENKIFVYCKKCGTHGVTTKKDLGYKYVLCRCGGEWIQRTLKTGETEQDALDAWNK